MSSVNSIVLCWLLFLFVVTPAILSRKIQQNLPTNPEMFMSSTEIIHNRGYPVETHTVKTEDGYILELHRIPSRRNGKAKPVFLMYGYFGTDAIWSLTPANRSLAYILSDRGYDVWMGNSRGNTYSRKHETLDPQKMEYWNFSWDEMGRYDIPASLLYVLKSTEQQKLVYIGNSLGCTLFFIAMASQPQLNDHIDVMIALAPVSTLNNMRSLPIRIMIQFFKPFQISGTKAFGDITTTPLLRRMQRLICETTYQSASLCREIMFAVIGSNRNNMDLTLIPMIHEFVPHGVSVNSLIHLFQHVKTGNLKAFDYGWRENKDRYGNHEPPEYDLGLVNAPVYIFWGENDLLATPKDISWLASKLGNLKASIRVPDPNFNHFDFLIGTNVYQVLYKDVLSLLPEP